MIIKTKFNLGDSVYPIKKRNSLIKEECRLCVGSGKITAIESSTTIICPTCQGSGGEEIWGNYHWSFIEDNIGMIGKVNVEKYWDKYNPGFNPNKIQYMLNSTGVGCGTCWDEDRLFLSESEAKREAKKRNREEGK